MKTTTTMTMMRTRMMRMGKPWRRSTCEKSGMLITSERTCKSHLLNKLENHRSLLTSKNSNLWHWWWWCWDLFELLAFSCDYVQVQKMGLVKNCDWNYDFDMAIEDWQWTILQNSCDVSKESLIDVDERATDNSRPPLLVTRAKPKLSLMLSRTQWL